MKSNKDTKYLVLDQNDTLNPHPEKVSDPLFQEYDFFDARDLIQVKYEMLRRVNFEKWPISQASETFGFSRPSFYKCLNAFKNNGFAGLIPHKRGPKNAHKLSPVIMAFIEDILKENQGLKAKDISEKIEEKFNLKIHLRSIHRALNKHKKKRN